jgi:hypothetical protein
MIAVGLVFQTILSYKDKNSIGYWASVAESQMPCRIYEMRVNKFEFYYRTHLPINKTHDLGLLFILLGFSQPWNS